MRLTFPPARLTGFAVLAVAGATALSVGACGSSNNANSPSATRSPASASGKARVSGLIASVSGNAVQVTQQQGSATVDFTPETKFTEVTPAQLTDVTAGSCVTVNSGPAGAPTPGTITAQWVRVSQAVDGKCPGPEKKAGALSGIVASIAGTAINVTGTDASGNTSKTNVTVTDTTKFSKQAPAAAQALAQGKCISARGTKGNGGTLQAVAITVQPADNGHCPQPAVKRHPH